MGEYGQVVGQSTGVGRGGGGGWDLGRDLMGVLEDVVDTIASQPPEILVAAGVIALVLAIIFFRR